jgi:hypothetical protein
MYVYFHVCVYIYDIYRWNGDGGRTCVAQCARNSCLCQGVSHLDHVITLIMLESVVFTYRV